MDAKPREKSKTLWFNGVLGTVSMVIAGVEFFTGFIKEIAPGWVYTSLLIACGLNNAVNWFLRLNTDRPVR
jgi:hypothetical protein